MICDYESPASSQDTFSYMHARGLTVKHSSICFVPLYKTFDQENQAMLVCRWHELLLVVVNGRVGHLYCNTAVDLALEASATQTLHSIHSHTSILVKLASGCHIAEIIKRCWKG